MMTQFCLNYFEVWSSESIFVNAIKCYALTCHYYDQVVRIRFLRNQVAFNSEILHGHSISSQIILSWFKPTGIKKCLPGGAVLACNCKKSTYTCSFISLFVKQLYIYSLFVLIAEKKNGEQERGFFRGFAGKKWKKDENYEIIACTTAW